MASICFILLLNWKTLKDSGILDDLWSVEHGCPCFHK